MSGVEDRGKGKTQEFKGKAKSMFGRATGDPGMRAEGDADQLRGKGKGMLGRVKTFLARKP